MQVVWLLHVAASCKFTRGDAANADDDANVVWYPELELYQCIVNDWICAIMAARQHLKCSLPSKQVCVGG